jgi:hypothetical protein
VAVRLEWSEIARLYDLVEMIVTNPDLCRREMMPVALSALASLSRSGRALGDPEVLERLIEACRRFDQDGRTAAALVEAAWTSFVQSWRPYRRTADLLQKAG